MVILLNWGPYVATTALGFDLDWLECVTVKFRAFLLKFIAPNSFCIK